MLLPRISSNTPKISLGTTVLAPFTLTLSVLAALPPIMLSSHSTMPVGAGVSPAMPLGRGLPSMGVPATDVPPVVAPAMGMLLAPAAFAGPAGAAGLPVEVVAGGVALSLQAASARLLRTGTTAKGRLVLLRIGCTLTAR